MSKMGSHDPFGSLKNKLWVKEGPWIKLIIWFPTTKSRELPWFPCVQMTCNIPLKSSHRRLQLWFKPHFNGGLRTKLWASKVVGVPIPGHDESCEYVFDCDLFVHQKCSSYTLANLLFGLCKFMWVINLLVIFPSPIPKFQHALLPSKCYESESAPQLFLFPLSSPLDSQLGP
jgi:hypothetical protein